MSGDDFKAWQWDALSEKQRHISDILRLAERCEVSTDNRDLDADILEATGGCAHRAVTKYVCQSDSGFTCNRCGKDTYGERVPKFTSSLDVALALVPDECREGYTRPFDGPVAAACSCADGSAFYGHARTPALALCAAALRARLAIADRNGNRHDNEDWRGPQDESGGAGTAIAHTLPPPSAETS